MYEQTTLFKTIKQLYKLRKNQTSIASTQETINFKKMYRNGVCKLTDKKYSKMIRFSDVSYQLAKDEEKQRLFNLYCTLLNSFDETITFQLCFMNFKASSQKTTTEEEFIYTNDDSYAKQRSEYLQFLKRQKEKGNSGIIKNKYLIFTIEERNYKSATRRLHAIERTVNELFKTLGVQTEAIEGTERLSILNYAFNSNSKYYRPIEELEEDEIFNSGLAKSLIAPSMMDFQTSKEHFKLPKKYGTTHYFNLTATELSDRVLVDLLEEDKELIVSLHIKPVAQQKAIKMVKSKNSDLNSTKIDEQKKSLQRGYDMDILPTDLNMFIDDSKKVLQELQKENEKYFYATITITAFEENLETLNDSLFTLQTLVQKQNCELEDMQYQQEKAFLSALPLGYNVNEKGLERGLTTSATASFIPFTTQELYQRVYSPIYYGLNALSNNMIQVSRKALKNPNGLCLGTPGSGKTFAVKREIIDVFLQTLDDILISDPEGEYGRFVELLKGEVINISLNSKTYINPLDINMVNYGDKGNPIAFKSDFILSMMNVIAGGKDGITPKQKTITDKATRKIYRKFLETSDKNDIPILEDLYNEFRANKSEPSQDLADALELYVHGSLNVFNHHTNINPQNRLICFDISQLGENIKDLAMLILQDYVWNKVTTNREVSKMTWYYMDEFHKLLAEQQTSNYSVTFWKQFRKYGGIPTGITQNVKDLLASPKIETILENSDFIYLLNQATEDRKTLQKKLEISDYQATYVTNSKEGEGLIIYNGIILPFKDKFPKNNSLYPVMTSKPSEIKDYIERGIIDA